MNCAELIKIAESANAPDTMPFPNEFGDHTFEARDGWKVVIFYDAGDLDYIDSFISPTGEVIQIVCTRDDALLDDPNWPQLANWR